VPKSDAGIRDVAIPPHLLPTVKTHIAEHAQFGRDGLLLLAKDTAEHPHEHAQAGVSTTPAQRRNGLIYVSTICGIPVVCWRPKQAPHWLNSWLD
jgi:hypothetical protein